MAGRRQWSTLPPLGASGDVPIGDGDACLGVGESDANACPGASSYAARGTADAEDNRESELEALSELVSQGDIAGIQAHIEKRRKLHGDLPVRQEILSCEHGGRNTKSALHLAAARGRAEVLRVLLATRVEPNAMDDTGNTPLHFAADLGHARAARVLLEAGANAKAGNNFGRTPEDNCKAQTWDSENIGVGKEWIRKMLAGTSVSIELLPAEPRPSTSRRRQSAPAAPSPGVSGELQSQGADAGANSVESMGGASSSVSRPQPTWGMDQPQLLTRSLELLSSLFGGDLSWAGVGSPAKTNPGSTYAPDLASVENGKTCRSASTGADLASVNQSASGSVRSSDTLSAESHSAQMSLRALIKRDDIPGVEAWLRRVFIEAVGDTVQKNRRVIRAVTTCEEGEEDTRIAQSGIHLAALLGKVDMLKVLLATHASPNVINDQGSTPLHLAVDLGRQEAVKVLMNAKANPKIRNNFGRCPDEVREGRNSQVISLDDPVVTSEPMSELLRCKNQGLGGTTVSVIYMPEKRRSHQNVQGRADEICTICCDEFQKGEQLRILACFHRYHTACIDQWIARSRTCPTCKHPIDVVS